MSQASQLTPCYAIIIAGGSGTRMRSAVPKQFLPLNGIPVLMHTINAFYNSASQPQIILALHPDFQAHWIQLCETHSFTVPLRLVNGGETRFHSVQNALELLMDEPDAIVAIQDAVRPLTSPQIIDETYKLAAIHGNAITAVKSRDSVRLLRDSVSSALLRDEVYLVQTPQTFRLSQLKNAYAQAYSPKFTDDASVVEQTGETIHLAEGSYENIKITFPEDIAIAELLLARRSLAGS